MKKVKNILTSGTLSYVFPVLLALAIRWALVEAYIIPSGSMLPTLLINDHIFVNKVTYGLRIPWTDKWVIRNNFPERGDVIVFRYPENESILYIKRVVGVPGDRVLYKEGQLYINDKAVEKGVPQSKKSDINWLSDGVFASMYMRVSDHDHWEEKLGKHTYSILQHKRPQYQETFGPYTVPPKSYFVMGDNRDNSKDSRRWSKTHFVHEDQLIGRAMFVWLSCENMLPVVSILCNPIGVRWDRFLHSIH